MIVRILLEYLKCVVPPPVIVNRLGYFISLRFVHLFSSLIVAFDEEWAIPVVSSMAWSPTPPTHELAVAAAAAAVTTSTCVRTARAA
jgi:hypothetical protein